MRVFRELYFACMNMEYCQIIIYICVLKAICQAWEELWKREEGGHVVQKVFLYGLESECM